jgi:hypothetical protein
MVTNSPPVAYRYHPYEEKSNSINNIKGPAFMVIESKTGVKGPDSTGAEVPDIPFEGAFFLVNHDSRLTLSSDTYVQLTVSAGLRVKVNKPSVDKATQKWIKKIKLEQKIEDGLYSYYDCGNMMFEIATLHSDYEEIDMATMRKAIRDKKKHRVVKYVSQVDTMSPEITLDPREVVHFKRTNARREAWGRGLYNALFAPRTVDGDEVIPIVEQWGIEHDMTKIFDSYASPIMMINFKDAGEEWIKQKEVDFKKIKAGAKIITDKEFEAKVFEVNGASKFDKYVEHRQTNIIEPGAQFPLAFFNGGFHNQKAEEISDSMFGRKVKREQKKIALQIKEEMIMPYVRLIDSGIRDEDVQVFFEIESKSEVGNAEAIQLFEKGALRRSELRSHLSKKTTLELDDDDMEDTPPITSTTPTNDLLTSQPSAASLDMDPNELQSKLMALQAQMTEMQSVIETKIPKPRGRPKKQE